MLRLFRWLQDSAPVWRWLLRVENRLRNLYCRVHGHSPVIDIKDRKQYCAVCGDVPGPRRFAERRYPESGSPAA